MQMMMTEGPGFGETRIPADGYPPAAAEDKRRRDGMDAALGERQITVDGCVATKGDFEVALQSVRLLFRFQGTGSTTPTQDSFEAGPIRAHSGIVKFPFSAKAGQDCGPRMK